MVYVKMVNCRQLTVSGSGALSRGAHIVHNIFNFHFFLLYFDVIRVSYCTLSFIISYNV